MNQLIQKIEAFAGFISQKEQRKTVVAALLGFVILVSAVLFLLQERPLGRFVLFFPHQKDGYMSGEERYLPLSWDRSRTMELVLKDNLLGPVRPLHFSLFGPGTRVNSFIFDGGKAYLDLSPEATFLWNVNNYWTLEEAFQALEDTLRFNFKEVSELSITVAGQVPFREISEKK